MTKEKAKKYISNGIFLLALAGILWFHQRYDLIYAASGSMYPAIETGAICVVDPEAYEEKSPSVGDIAVYKTETRYVVHRVISDEGDGWFEFKGDNNDASDFGAVHINDIHGQVKVVINAVSPLIRAIKHLE